MKNGLIIKCDGIKKYYKDDKLHREDGPAVEYVNGTKDWYIDGKLHREDGPAVEWSDGYKEWWLNGTYHSENEFNEIMLKKS
jgi:hypothetical protein